MQKSVNRYSFQSIVGGRYISTFPYISAKELESSNDIFIKLNYGQRIDTLAHQFLGSGEYWWIICLLNNLKTPYDKSLIVGKVLRIPTSVNRILQIIENKAT